MRSAALLVLASLVALSAPAWAEGSLAASQGAAKILRINPFTGDGLSSGEASAVQGMVMSYINDYKLFRVIDAAAQELALKEAEAAIQMGSTKEVAPLTADYILSATAQSAGGLIVFSLDLTRVSSGEKRNVAKAVPTVNDLILSLRGITDSLFDRTQSSAPTGADTGALASSPPPQGSSSPASPSPSSGGQTVPVGQEPSPAMVKQPTLAMLTGTWSGDKGIDRISIFRDGRGVAILSGGSSMKVKATIAGSSIIVVQDEPSSANFYKGVGLDLKAAREIASKARPWRWIFALAQDGKSLIGTKESVFVTMDKGVITVDNNYAREARWSRLFR